MSNLQSLLQESVDESYPLPITYEAFLGLKDLCRSALKKQVQNILLPSNCKFGLCLWRSENSCFYRRVNTEVNGRKGRRPSKQAGQRRRQRRRRRRAANDEGDGGLDLCVYTAV